MKQLSCYPWACVHEFSFLEKISSYNLNFSLTDLEITTLIFGRVFMF
jgi:hypothetical protein